MPWIVSVWYVCNWVCFLCFVVGILGDCDFCVCYDLFVFVGDFVFLRYVVLCLFGWGCFVCFFLGGFDVFYLFIFWFLVFVEV